MILGDTQLLLARQMQESNKIVLLKPHNFMDRHCNTTLILWLSKSHLGKSAVREALFFCHVESQNALHCCAWAFPCSRALLARASSRMFPSGANASDCMKHRKGERLIQVVCVKRGLRDHQGQVGLCTEQIWGSLFCRVLPRGAAPSSSPCFPAASSCPGPRLRGTLTPELILFVHLSSPAAPWTSAGTEEVAARASPPASASSVPFVTASPRLVSG